MARKPNHKVGPDKRPSLRRPAVILALLVAFAGFGAAATRADTYTWQGPLGAGVGNGNCTPWYPGQSACAPYYGNWYLNYAHHLTGDTILAGFQNSSTIRGIYLYNEAYGSVTPGQLSMGGSVLPGITWCTWSPCKSLYFGSQGWFEAYL